MDLPKPWFVLMTMAPVTTKGHENAQSLSYRLRPCWSPETRLLTVTWSMPILESCYATQHCDDILAHAAADDSVWVICSVAAEVCVRDRLPITAEIHTNHVLNLVFKDVLIYEGPAELFLPLYPSSPNS